MASTQRLGVSHDHAAEKVLTLGAGKHLEGGAFRLRTVRFLGFRLGRVSTHWQVGLNSHYPKYRLSEKLITGRFAQRARTVADLPPDLRSTRYARLREIIVTARKKADLSQTAVAIRLGRPQSYVADIERSERRIDVIEYLALADAVGFDPVKVIRQVLAVAE